MSKATKEFKYHIFAGSQYKKHTATNSWAEACRVYEQLKKSGQRPHLHAVAIPVRRAV